MKHICWPGLKAVIIAIVEPLSKFATKGLAMVIPGIAENTEKTVTHTEGLPTLITMSGWVGISLSFLESPTTLVCSSYLQNSYENVHSGRKALILKRPTHPTSNLSHQRYCRTFDGNVVS